MNRSMLDAGLRRFIGASIDADDQMLLGLGQHEVMRADAIDAAARRRIEQVMRHPGAGGPDAELVLSRIRLAAGRLRGRASAAADADADRTGPSSPPASDPAAGPSPTRPVATPSSPTAPAAAAASATDRPQPSLASRRRVPASLPTSREPGRPDPASLPPLTQFDRAVLGTLVGHGGWNRRSRARLVALADAHGVGPRGLMNVVRGLAAYAAAGGRPAGLDEIAGDFAVIAGGRAAGLAAAGAGSTSGASAAMDEAAELTRRLLPELEEPGVWPVLKLATAVLLVIGLAAIPLVRVLAPSPSPAAPPPAAIGGSNAPGGGAALGGGSTPAGRGTGSTSGGEASGPPGSDAARLVFARIPFIAGPPPAPELLEAADAMAGLSAEIEREIRRRLEVGTPPTDATYRRWNALMDEAARGWTRAAPSDVRAVRRAASATIVAAGERTDVVDRLMDALTPPIGDDIAGPGSDGVPPTWAGSWRISVLAAVAADPFAPDAGRRASRALLESSLGVAGAAGAGAFDPRPEAGPLRVAAAWLELAAAQLVASLAAPPPDELALAEAWERWFEAAEALDAASSVAVLRPRLLVAAAESLLGSPVSLGPGEAPSEVLGRLLQSLPAPPDAALLDLLERAHADRSLATTADLRAAASILALRRDLPWFRATFVLPEDASDATRDRFLQRIASVWPATTGGAEAGRPLAVDAQGLLEWRELRAAVDAMPTPVSPLAELRRAAQLGELLEAAHLLAAGRRDEAAAVLDALDEDLQRPDDRPGGGVAPARPAAPPGLAEPDGAWTRSWEATRGRGDTAVARIRALRIEAGRDLGPVDARTFAELVTRTGSQRVQEAARAVLLEKFRDGPNVVMEVLDALPDARIERDLRESVHQLVGVTIPATDAEQWRSLARTALLEYAATIIGPEGDPAGRLERRLAETLDRRAAILGRRPATVMGTTGPAAAAFALADAWLAAASARVSVQPVPAPASEIRRRDELRRRLARDSMQSSVAGLIGVMEALAFVVVAEQPATAQTCRQILETCRNRRDEASRASEQWLAIERALTDLWVVRFGLGGDDAAADASKEQRP